MQKRKVKTIISAVAGFAVGILLAYSISSQLTPGGVGMIGKETKATKEGVSEDVVDSALKTYVPPGQLDDIIYLPRADIPVNCLFMVYRQ